VLRTRRGGHCAVVTGPPSQRPTSRGELYISETTVKFHVGNLMRKLMVSRRAEAVYAATKLGLL
jgi:FixJ family two-component response regulator